MGVASPFQSAKPMEYWLDGLTTAELVRLWEFLSGNQTDNYEPDRDVFKELSTPDAEVVRKTLYSESLPSSFLCPKTEAASRSSEPHPGQ